QRRPGPAAAPAPGRRRARGTARPLPAALPRAGGRWQPAGEGVDVLTEVLHTPRPARRLLDNLRPSVVTGGAPGMPLLVLAGIAFFDQFDKNAFAALTPEIQDFFGLDLT